MKNVFDSIPVPKLGRSYFDLSHTHMFDCDAGQIIPFVSFPFMPGDHFKLGNNIVVRPQPMVKPILSQVKVYTYYFAVSNRLMFGDMVLDSDGKKRWEIKDRAFERFISGGETGDDTTTEPRWAPYRDFYLNDNWNGIPAGQPGSNANDINVSMAGNMAKYSLWDYFGLPVLNAMNVTLSSEEELPLAYQKRAYNLIYNWYFRDKNFMDEINVADNEKVLNCCWRKDYFTSALPWTQRGPVPSIPIQAVFSDVAGISPIDLRHHFSTVGTDRLNTNDYPYLRFFGGDSSTTNNSVYLGGYASAQGGTGSLGSHVELGAHTGTVLDAENLNTHLKLTTSSITINDLRLTARLQQWMERNAITGIDYRQFVLAHFGVAPADERLQKPLFLGSSVSPLWISEVVQTSESSDTAQGNLSGHGLTASSNFVCRYSAKEFGWIVGVIVIKPTPSYQQGVPRYLLYRNRYEYPFPEFMHLGERAIYSEELYFQESGNFDDETNDFRIFGYTGMYNELRYMSDIVSGGLRDTFNYWHWGRIFNSLPALNSNFLKMRPDKRIFLVQNEPSFVCNVGNVIQAWRPMPKYPVPSVL